MGLLTLGLGVFIYLIMPRPDALNLGAYEVSDSDFYHDDSWLQHAAKSLSKSGEKPQNSGEFHDNNEPEKESGGSGEIKNLSGYDRADYQYDGFSEAFDLDAPQRRVGVDLNALVARMKAPHGTYLKVRTFDTFDGSRWTVSNADISRKIETDRRGHVRLVENGEGDFQYTITLETSLTAWLPISPDVVALWVPASSIALDQFDHPLLPGRLKSGTVYTAHSVNRTRDLRLISHAPAPNMQDLQLPAGLDARIGHLALSVTAQQTRGYQKAVALETHLRSNYQYSFESILKNQGKTPLAKFLFEEKAGHCEFFASAMVIMLRTLNIPARLVTGFSVTTQNPLTGYFEIHTIDGHAWSEAWIDNEWVTFEPTGYYVLPQQEQSRVAAEQISQYAQDMLKRSDQTGDGRLSVSAIISGLWLLIYTMAQWH